MWSIAVVEEDMMIFQGIWRNVVLAACGVLLGAGVALAKDPAGRPTEDVLKGLVQEHPRLLMKKNDLASLKARHATDPVLQRIIKDALADADSVLAKPLLKHVLPDGKRLLATSRDCLNRTIALGFAYRWTGDRKYADKGIEILLTVCAFPDWNPKHFLDTAEMSNAVGIGYDWFFDAMDPTVRKTVRKGLIRLGLAGDSEKVCKSKNNWNMVCNGGLVVGALAVAETDPRYARAIIPRALQYLPIAMKDYAPDGAWMEGPGYWQYATSYVVYMCASMDSALGHDFGITKTTGLDKSGYFTVYTTGPSGHFLCFADAGSPKFNSTKTMPFVRSSIPCLFWLAGKYRNPDFSDAEHVVIARQRANALHAVWYRPRSGVEPMHTLDRFFDGPVPVFLARASWSDPDTLWCGVKAGFNKVSHGHLDLGNFELESGGVRWAIDLGADDYNMPDYFGKKRWTYYRLISESHNVPLIDGKGQLPDGVAKVLETHVNEAVPRISIDLTDAYRDRVSRLVRTVSMTDARKKIQVCDQFMLAKPAELVWGMTTDAEIGIKPGGVAVLKRNGKTLEARILAPSGAEFSSESAEQKPPQKKNDGVSRLLVRAKAPAGNTRILVEFSPGK